MVDNKSKLMHTTMAFLLYSLTINPENISEFGPEKSAVLLWVRLRQRNAHDGRQQSSARLGRGWHCTSPVLLVRQQAWVLRARHEQRSNARPLLPPQYFPQPWPELKPSRPQNHHFTSCLWALKEHTCELRVGNVDAEQCGRAVWHRRGAQGSSVRVLGLT